MIFTIVSSEEKDLRGGQIDRPGILKLVSSFRDNQYKTLNNTNESVCAFFTKKEIVDFLDSSKETDGLRIYFACVPQGFEGAQANYAGHMTIVCVATKQAYGGSIDEELLDANSKVLIASPLKEDEHGVAKTTDRNGYDFATLCPPDCGRVHAGVTPGVSIKDDVYTHKVPV